MSHSGKLKWYLIKGFLVAEAVAFLASYRLWHRMNTDREYRKWMYDNYPSVLEGFYKCAELGGYDRARIEDYIVWGVDK